eukprot:gene11244-18869_t
MPSSTLPLTKSQQQATALLTTTDMATKGIRFLRRQYGAVAGDQEFASFTALYGATIGMEEGLTSYLVRCQ